MKGAVADKASIIGIGTGTTAAAADEFVRGAAVTGFTDFQIVSLAIAGSSVIIQLVFRVLHYRLDRQQKPED